MTTHLLSTHSVLATPLLKYPGACRKAFEPMERSYTGENTHKSVSTNTLVIVRAWDLLLQTTRPTFWRFGHARFSPVDGVIPLLTEASGGLIILCLQCAATHRLACSNAFISDARGTLHTVVRAQCVLYKSEAIQSLACNR